MRRWNVYHDVKKSDFTTVDAHNVAVGRAGQLIFSRWDDGDQVVYRMFAKKRWEEVTLKETYFE